MKTMTKVAALGLCLLSAMVDAGAYPTSWWQEVPRDQAASWEILPQNAGPGEVILSKRTELGILSNFAATPFVFDDVRYASLEGFWQMLKFPEGPSDVRFRVPGVSWPYERDAVGQLTAFEAKTAGDFGSDVMRKLGINWVSYRGVEMPYRIAEKGVHYDLIRRAMQAKLAQNFEVRRLLLATGDLTLKADHAQAADASPAWLYNVIWMELRAELARGR